MQEHRRKMNSTEKRAFELLDELRTYLAGQGVSARNMEYHMGRNYSSKHHNPSK